MNSGAFQFQREIESPGRVEPLDPHRMPTLFQGESDRLLDATVQAVVVDHEVAVDEEPAAVVAGQMQCVDAGLPDSKEAFEDETAMFVAGPR